MAGRLAGRAAIVTGAGSSGPGWGNGKATAVTFAREGAKVLAVDLRREAAEETRALVAGEGGTCEVFAGDVSRAADVAAMVETCLARFGAVDVLHNNVGIVEVGGPEEISEADWDRVVRINLKSMFLATRAVLPHMVRQFEARGGAAARARGGAIVNVGSISGIRWTGVPYIAYTTTKGAAIPFTLGVALQYAGRGIRCNAILPGLMNTPMIVQPLKGVYGAGDVAAMVAKRDAQCPMGHMGDAWDVANAALFLASDESRYVTGVALPVDGGITMKFA
jgi:NAD(P)-dependent dehydrogenase (short-subunit alcohol dehydrogenase family)